MMNEDKPRKRHYCLAVCKRSDWYNRCHGIKVKFEYIHYTALSHDEALEYGKRYSVEHEGMVVCVSQRGGRSSIPGNKFAWTSLCRFYNGRNHTTRY